MDRTRAWPVPNAVAGAIGAHFREAHALNGTHFGTKSQLVEAAKLVQRSCLLVGEQAVEPI
jgi:hypothetical protein